MLKIAFCLTLLPGLALGEPVTCPGGQITLTGESPYGNRICKVAEQAVEELASCNLPLFRPISVSLADELEDNCVGLYHCGEDRIELLRPERLSAIIDQSALFSQLGLMEYFDSILFHELAHAAADAIPCPNATCPATSEYLAYALQIRALSPENREKMGLGDVPETIVGRDAINAIMVFWAPDRFARAAWTHLMQRPDPCGYVGLIARGNIIFDVERP